MTTKPADVCFLWADGNLSGLDSLDKLTHENCDPYHLWQSKQSILSVRPALHRNTDSTRLYNSIQKIAVFIYIILDWSLAYQAKAPQFDSERSHISLWGCIRKGHKNLPNQTCRATCCGDPLWKREQLKVAFLERKEKKLPVADALQLKFEVSLFDNEKFLQGFFF